MRCEEFVRLLEEEGDALAPEATAHAASCPACGRALEHWRSVRHELRAMADEPVPPFLSARVMAAVRAERAGHRQAAPVPAPWRTRAAPAFAAVAVVALGGWALWQALHGAATPPQEARNATVAEGNRERGAMPRTVADKTEPAPAAAPPLPAPAASAPQRQPAVATTMSRAQVRRQAIDETRAATPQPAGAGESAGGAGRDQPRVGGGAVGGVLAAAPAVEKAAAPPAALMTASAERPRAIARLDTAAEAPGAGAVQVRLTHPGGATVLAASIAPDAAPPPGIVWRVIVATDGIITLRDADGHDIGGSHNATIAFLRAARLAPGEYRLSR